MALPEKTMLKPNSIGVKLAEVQGVNAMTDVTGFGLAGHLSEMCQASNVMAQIDFRKLPRLAEAEAYRRQGAVPGGTLRNRDALGESLPAMDEVHWQWLCDPQTSGGLLLSVDPAWEDDVERIGREYGLTLQSFGVMRASQGKATIEVVG
ncbi:hypothetical protein HSBAA_54940 [Vreelandella sulfidaeris]|uniref:PurM-like C-terminal domain-containing protein n=1 Tax=Vreelandella sulfidaeris TaxID=115553 RepID=A0A455UIK4_9GAMM|nr:hypothetical protein HSBAA_54940 [Halomonas sulfidaeris]